MMLGSRRSSRVSKVEKSYEEEDEIEIVGDTEMEKKNAERVDKNFSKMTLKGQREAMEAFKSSTLYSTEEEGEEELEKPRKVVKKGRKRKVLVEEDSDSDIEILDSPNEKKFSTGDKPECDIGVEEDTSMCVSITPMSTPMSKTTSNNNNKISSPTNKSNLYKKPFEEELNLKGQKQDLVQVKHLFYFLVVQHMPYHLVNCAGEVCLWQDNAG